jgi:GNAT superfamily N-acetyltransferase
LTAVRHLIHSTIDACYPSFYPPEAVDFFKEYHSYEAIAERAQEGCTIVVERDGQVIGTGTLVDDHITAVFVQALLQGQGIGTRIMKHLERKALAVGMGSVSLDASLPSKRFYDSLGYAMMEEASLAVANDESLDFYRVRKNLERGRENPDS